MTWVPGAEEEDPALPWVPLRAASLAVAGVHVGLVAWARQEADEVAAAAAVAVDTAVGVDQAAWGPVGGVGVCSPLLAAVRVRVHDHVPAADAPQQKVAQLLMLRPHPLNLSVRDEMLRCAGTEHPSCYRHRRFHWLMTKPETQSLPRSRSPTQEVLRSGWLESSTAANSIPSTMPH